MLRTIITPIIPKHIACIKKSFEKYMIYPISIKRLPTQEIDFLIRYSQVFPQ
jgi:hypothetical protein